MFDWKYTSYLKKGLSHEKAGTNCQDSVVVKDDEHCIVAALADGLGSLKYSDVAASTATLTVCELFASLGQKKITIESDTGRQDFAKDIVQRIAQKINDKAAGMGVPVSTMDCTLVFVYISKDHNYAITGRLGDSAICIIKKDGSIAINDSSQSANGTSAILDKDAHEHMEISFWDIEADKVYGFILTSDGLDNELYRKGSMCVNKAAEAYFNAVVSPNPQKVIQNKIAELTKEGSLFDDDISIAVINRATKAISLPNDPTWLCTCGERNRLQDTYCYNCSKDFSVLYQNIRFKEHGGKTAFFLDINKHPNEEARIIGLHSKPTPKKPRTDSNGSEAVSVVTGEEVKKVANKKGNQGPRNNIQLLIVVGMICLLAGLVVGSMLTHVGVSKNIRELSEKIDVLTASVQILAEDPNKIPEVAKPEENTTESAEAAKTEPTVMLPENILVDTEGVYYWGETKDGIPQGQGIYLKYGYYYICHFVEGKKDGEFVITPKSDPTRNIVIVYEDDEIITNDLSFDKYAVSCSSLNVHSQAGLNSSIIGELKNGDFLFRTDATSITKDDSEWVEIISDDIIGWVAFDTIAMEDS